MNNNQPFTEKDKAFTIPNTTGVAVQGPTTLTGLNDANIANNALNTFQNVEQKGKDKQDNTDYNKLAEAISNTTKSTDSSQTENSEQNAASDFRLKILDDDTRLDTLFGNHDILDAISDLNAYRFKYKPGAEKIDPDATPDKERVGVMAQELASNPVTESTVEEDPLSGFLTVNTKELSLTTFALVTEMAKRIKELEAKIANLQ